MEKLQIVAYTFCPIMSNRYARIPVKLFLTPERSGHDELQYRQIL